MCLNPTSALCVQYAHMQFSPCSADVPWVLLFHPAVQRYAFGLTGGYKLSTVHECVCGPASHPIPGPSHPWCPGAYPFPPGPRNPDQDSKPEILDFLGKGIMTEVLKQEEQHIDPTTD